MQIGYYTIKQFMLDAPLCEYCGCPGAVEEPSRRVDVVVGVYLCAECAKEYHDIWDEMWLEHANSLGIGYWAR